MAEQLAVIKGVGAGMRDAPYPILWFNVYVSDGVAALQCIPWDEAGKLVKKEGIHEIHELEGKPCYVETDGMTIKFLRLAKIGK